MHSLFRSTFRFSPTLSRFPSNTGISMSCTGKCSTKGHRINDTSVKRHKRFPTNRPPAASRVTNGVPWHDPPLPPPRHSLLPNPPPLILHRATSTSTLAPGRSRSGGRGPRGRGGELDARVPRSEEGVESQRLDLRVSFSDFLFLCFFVSFSIALPSTCRVRVGSVIPTGRDRGDPSPRGNLPPPPDSGSRHFSCDWIVPHHGIEVPQAQDRE